jgi:hypothetical protein
MHNLVPAPADPQPLQGTVLPPGGAPDAEVAALMEELSKLQTLLTLQMRNGPVWIAAADLVQRTRCLIVERLYPGARR